MTLPKFLEKAFIRCPTEAAICLLLSGLGVPAYIAAESGIHDEWLVLAIPLSAGWFLLNLVFGGRAAKEAQESISRAKNRISDSRLGRGRIYQHPISMTGNQIRISYSQPSNFFYDASTIDTVSGRSLANSGNSECTSIPQTGRISLGSSDARG